MDTTVMVTSSYLSLIFNASSRALASSWLRIDGTPSLINVPVLGIIENMAYFTPEELPENRYYIFGKEGARNLATDLNVPFLGEVPIVQSIREAGDYGRPAALQTGSIIGTVFENITRNVVQETVNRNESLPATEAIKITTMAGCSAVKK